jgi:hypothetical protein
MIERGKGVRRGRTSVCRSRDLHILGGTGAQGSRNYLELSKFS